MQYTKPNKPTMAAFPKLQEQINSVLNQLKQQPRVNEETKESFFLEFSNVRDLNAEFVGTFAKFVYSYDSVNKELFYPAMLMQYQQDGGTKSTWFGNVKSQSQGFGESWESKVKDLIVQQISVYERDKRVNPRIWLTKKQAEGAALKLSKALIEKTKVKSENTNENKSVKTKIKKNVSKPI